MTGHAVPSDDGTILNAWLGAAYVSSWTSAGMMIAVGARSARATRMAADEQHGVVDRYGQTFAVPNLYIADGSVLPTQGSANPALTIMAVAARTARHLAAGSS